MLSEKDLELFDRYLQGNCRPEEAQFFEQRLNDEPELKKEFEAFKTAVFLLKRGGFKELVNEEEKPGKSPFLKIGWLIVLIIALLAVFYFFNNQQEEKSTDQIFAEYFEPFPDLISTRSSAQGVDRAMEAYNNGDYNIALQMLDTNQYDQPIVHLYRAISRLAIKEGQEHSFQDEIDFLPENHLFDEEVKWYQVLYQLKSDDISGAIELLKDINEGEFKSIEAQQLLRDLDTEEN